MLWRLLYENKQWKLLCKFALSKHVSGILSFHHFKLLYGSPQFGIYFGNVTTASKMWNDILNQFIFPLLNFCNIQISVFKEHFDYRMSLSIYIKIYLAFTS